MPTYAYRCTECGNAFDVQQSFTDDSLTECPACSGKLRKLFSAVGVTFNGSGFYRTDSRAGAGKGSSSIPASSKSSEGSSSSPSGATSGSSSAGSSTSSTPSTSAGSAAS
ncbi:putative regulatory protein, FmdB family [Plantibacter flavus]|uniref:Putative FmdB family regulatory protein n=1 Tax=Plantibacter flavus TaxID=150123 RepID=A0A3N2C0Y3_9MICO|nr:FmdB family zinc ribbon protein [Plantibacter flavus]ROR81162.1 putative FmdB family regulatory protein [Plantibacter flavus]SMG08601.1 putative regulatory protein, FmdB family [Plantibacter flavus]